MVDTPKTIIPTLSKSKIAHHLSYPIGAECISEALSAAPQLHSVKLHYYSYWFDRSLRKHHYEFLRVEYLLNRKQVKYDPMLSLLHRPPQSQWEIVVQPVRRICRHPIKQYILDSALPRIGQWLIDRAELSQQGSDILAFFYDEPTGEFTSRQLTRLEPLRI
jgi:hypothetical protein